MVKLSDDFNGADLRNVCTEAGKIWNTAILPQTYISYNIISVPGTFLYLCWNIPGMFAIRAERDYVIEEDFMKAVRKVADNKKLETKLDYKPI